MTQYAIIGAGFGDEGKGRVVDYLCHTYETSLVLRFCGGHQAGHHVVSDDFDHVFSNFGSGTYRGVPTYWSEYCTFDPVGFLNEYDDLLAKGVNPKGLYLNAQCPVVTLLDKIFNTKDALNKIHGTCGVGFGATLRRHEAGYKITVSDLYRPSILRIKLALLKKYYEGLQVRSLEWDDLDKVVASLTEFTKFHFVHCVPRIPGYLRSANVLFEGSQGLLLDRDFGFFPHVTYSKTGSHNFLEMGENPTIVLVTRAYQTRHGNGPMTNEDIRHYIKKNPYEVETFGVHQGPMRKTVLDIDLLEYAIRSDRKILESPDKILCVTCLDLMEGHYALTENGKLLEFPDMDKFVGKICDSLGIRTCYISKSPIKPLSLYRGDKLHDALT